MYTMICDCVTAHLTDTRAWVVMSVVSVVSTGLPLERPKSYDTPSLKAMVAAHAHGHKH